MVTQNSVSSSSSASSEPDLYIGEAYLLLHPTDLASSGSFLASAPEIEAETQGAKSPYPLLVILPGAFTPAEDYLLLARAIRAESESQGQAARLWTGILKFSDLIPSEEKVEQGFSLLLQHVESQLGDGSLQPRVFFFGHSWGAFCGREPAIRLAHAFIQYGSYFPSEKDDLLQYPRPVLTLLGGRDGQIPPTVLAGPTRHVAQSEPFLGESHTVAVKPVVVVEGVNHAQVSHGRPNLERGDLEGDVSDKDARVAVARLMCSFIRLHCNPSPTWEVGWDGPPADETSYKALRSAVRHTQGLLSPFWEAQKEEGEEGGALATECTACQREVLVQALPSSQLLPSPLPFNCHVTLHKFFENFKFSKPWVGSSSGSKDPTIHLHAFLSPRGKWKVSHSLWLKMKSADALAAAFESLPSIAAESEAAGANFPSRVGAEINRNAFERALLLVHPETRAAFERAGKRVEFTDDILMVKSPNEWLESDVEVLYPDGQPGLVQIRTPVLITSADFMLPATTRFAGMHYVKVITVAWAIDWIMMDALREGPPPAVTY